MLGTFIALPYAADQNCPSKPFRVLVKAKDEADLKRQAFILWEQEFEEMDGRFKKEDQYGFGDYSISESGGDYAIFFTKLTE